MKAILLLLVMSFTMFLMISCQSLSERKPLSEERLAFVISDRVVIEHSRERDVVQIIGDSGKPEIVYSDYVLNRTYILNFDSNQELISWVEKNFGSGAGLASSSASSMSGDRGSVYTLPSRRSLKVGFSLDLNW